MPRFPHYQQMDIFQWIPLEQTMSHHNQRMDRDVNGRLLRAYRRPPFPMSTPGWWCKLMMTRPKRRETALACHRVVQGDDPDGMVFPLGNHKPHSYYW
jgi:hypothetical protein